MLHRIDRHPTHHAPSAHVAAPLARPGHPRNPHERTDRPGGDCAQLLAGRSRCREVDERDARLAPARRRDRTAGDRAPDAPRRRARTRGGSHHRRRCLRPDLTQTPRRDLRVPQRPRPRRTRSRVGLRRLPSRRGSASTRCSPNWTPPPKTRRRSSSRRIMAAPGPTTRPRTARRWATSSSLDHLRSKPVLAGRASPPSTSHRPSPTSPGSPHTPTGKGIRSSVPRCR